MLHHRLALAAGACLLPLAAATAIAQAPPPASTSLSSDVTKQAKGAWVPPGTRGSPIDGTIFHAQVLLDVAGFPAGPIDGRPGQSLKRALMGFQTAHGIQPSGNLDNDTRAALLQQNRPSTIMVKLSADQVAGPFTNPIPRKPEEQAKLSCLCYRNMLEEVAEEFHTTPATIIALNGPDKQIGVGQLLRLPNVATSDHDYGKAIPQKYWGEFAKLNVSANQPSGDYVVVNKKAGVLQVYQGPIPEGPYSTNNGKKGAAAGTPPAGVGENAKLIAQFNVTMGSTHDPLPLGKWKVPTYAFMPKFHYQPNLFWDAKDKTADDRMLPPGPNGPVGVAWLDLTKEHYGIHGTNSPETIGRAESHGCVRMTNWDVLRLSRMMKPGFTAIFISGDKSPGGDSKGSSNA